MEKTMDKIVALAKSRGFVYPGSEIYGGLANTWDYGNLGVELKNNVKKAWWKKFVQENPYNVGVDCAILMNPQTWVASETKIPRNVRLSEAPSHGKPVMYYDKNSKGAEYYELLGHEILNEEPPKKKEKKRQGKSPAYSFSLASGSLLFSLFSLTL